MLNAGMPPSEVAEKVFQAIVNERFYIFPHPEFMQFVRSRMENILSGTNPTFNPPLPMPGMPENT
jgi:hypothetical protein